MKPLISFDDMDLPGDLLRGIRGYGSEKPTDIQRRGIISLLKGLDTIVLAEPDAERSKIFCISSLKFIDMDIKDTQVLIVSPTQYNAYSITKQIKGISEYLKATCYPCLNDTNECEDVEALRAGVQIVVGTPLRVYELIDRGALQMDSVKCFIIDDADQMGNWGYKDMIRSMLQHLPRKAQVCIFSTVMPDLAFASQLMRDPVQMVVDSEEPILEGIKQLYVSINREKSKLDVLAELYDALAANQAVIYCNTRAKAEWLSKQVIETNAKGVYHDQTPAEHETMVKELRSGAIRVIITTDSFARDPDFQELTLVINYDLPISSTEHLHRIKRSSRLGRKRIVINFVTEDGIRKFRELEDFYGNKIEEMPKNITDLI